MRWDRDDVLIDGHWLAAGEIISVENPATGKIIGSGAAGNAGLVDKAVVAARAASQHWSHTEPIDRADQVDALIEVLHAHRDELVAATVAEVGAPIEVAGAWHIDLALDILASAARHARTFDFSKTVGNSLLLRRPAGIVGCITPWNYPFYQLVGKVGSALAAGCTVVHKPAELTPLSAYLFAEATIEAGLPAGVFNLVPGTGVEVGAPLAAHPGIDLMSFTGSAAVGRQVAAAAVGNLNRVCLELGGKSASIVCEDADFETAVRWTVDACMLNTGQTCSAWTRLLIPAGRYDEALNIAVARAEEIVVGDPQDQSTELGPLISAQHRERVLDMVQGALDRGAQMVTGSVDRLAGTGHYLSPIILADLPIDDPASTQEIFGPVLVVHPFDSEEDAIAIANNTQYGLSGAVWSTDQDRAIGIAACLDTGQVDINGADFNIEAPFGGWRNSGFGREFGGDGLLEFTELTAIQH